MVTAKEWVGEPTRRSVSPDEATSNVSWRSPHYKMSESVGGKRRGRIDELLEVAIEHADDVADVRDAEAALRDALREGTTSWEDLKDKFDL